MLLLDTCTLLWLVEDHTRLSAVALDSLRGNVPFVSAISAFEIGQKYHTGRLQLPLPPATWFLKALELHGLSELPVTARIALAATDLPPLHRDPADRLIVATALCHHIPVLTPDRLIAQYPGVTVHW